MTTEADFVQVGITDVETPSHEDPVAQLALKHILQLWKEKKETKREVQA